MCQNINIGDKIICSNPIKPLKEGKSYIADGLKKAPCCGVLMVDVGISDNNNPLPQDCTSCGKSFPTDGIHWFRASRFSKPQNDIVTVKADVVTEFLQLSNN